MFIKLTNANPQLKDQPIIIRKDNIISVYISEIEWKNSNTDEKVVDISNKEVVTVVFCGDVGTGYVQESIDTIFKNL